MCNLSQALKGLSHEIDLALMTYTEWLVLGLEHLKNLKDGPVPFLGLELTKHVIQSQIHLMRQSQLTKSLSYTYFTVYFSIFLSFSDGVAGSPGVSGPAGPSSSQRFRSFRMPQR